MILEGARAVGETRLLRRLLDQGAIRRSVSLTDPTQRAAAIAEPVRWLRGLTPPFAIDEAQLAPELPLALKALLDERGDELGCLLTGSASIGRAGLGGADPLARRADRYTLEPLTEAEVAGGATWSVVDHLISKTPIEGARALRPRTVRR